MRGLIECGGFREDEPPGVSGGGSEAERDGEVEQDALPEFAGDRGDGHGG